MHYLVLYLVFSLTVGLLGAGIILFRKRRLINDEESNKKAGELYLDRKVEEGHLQKAVLPDRNVYHENDLKGELSVKSVEDINSFSREHPMLYTLILFVVGSIHLAVTWPRQLLIMVSKVKN